MGKLSNSVCLAGLLLLSISSAQTPGGAADSGIIATGASLQKLAGGFAFTEGPACDSEGNVYFTDQPNDRIAVWHPGGAVTTFLQPAGRANGLCFDRNGDLWACADENNQLWKITKSGKPEVVVKDFEGKLLDGPNDVWLERGGGLFFTDPFYKRPYWRRGPEEQSCQGVYYLSSDRKSLRRTEDTLKQPNGIIGTPDGKTLYVADIGDGKTYRYHVGKSGALTDKTLFCSMGSDGMTIDSDGNVYLTGNGVTVFDKAGKQIEHIAVPESWTANVCFGGKDRKTLFITASASIYGMAMRVHGVGSQ